MNIKIDEELLEDTYYKMAELFREKMLDKFIEEFVRDIIDEEDLEEYKSPNDALESSHLMYQSTKNRAAVTVESSADLRSS